MRDERRQDDEIQKLENQDIEMTEMAAEEFARLLHEEGMDLEIPEKLQPENIRKHLEDSAKVVRIKRRRRWVRFAAAAATLVLLAGAGNAVWRYQQNQEAAKGRGTVPNKVNEDDKTANGDADGETADGNGTDVECLSYAGSYDVVDAAIEEILAREEERMKDVAKKSERYEIQEEAEMTDDAASGTTNDMEAATGTAKADSADGVKDNAASKADDYSETNVQVEGVDEADVVKTDGSYIYRLREDKQLLEILKVDGKTIKKSGEYVFPDGEQVAEFYLHGDTIAVVLQSYAYVGETDTGKKKYAMEEDIEWDDDYDYYVENYTSVRFLDIRDRKNPTVKHELTQTGGYVQSRLSDGYLYVVTGEEARTRTYRGYKEETNIPCVEGAKVSADRIYIPEGTTDTCFTTVASIDLENPDKYFDNRSIMVNSDDFYMSTENIYLYNGKYSPEDTGAGEYTNRTQITKFHYKNGKFSGKATAEVEGIIKDAFAINEYDGKLRVLTSIQHIERTTVFDDIKEAIIGYRDRQDWTDNSVYVLDDGLKVLGSISGIAKDERIYSARFQGDIGYFVTYRETDPLFSVDFSNPAKPELIGELKIPGFSEYLHFYSDGLLLGIGRDGGGSGDGEEYLEEHLKLSMFDISDPRNVKEIDKYVIKDMDYSSALYNYKAVLIDVKKNIIGFAGESYHYEDNQSYHYNVYSYSKKNGFERKLQHKFNLKEGGDEYGYYYYGTEDARGVYIGDYLYIVSRYRDDVVVYGMKKWKKLAEYAE